MRPASKRLDPVSSLSKRAGASPSCLRVSHDARLFSLIPSIRSREAEAAAFRRARVRAPFVQRGDRYATILVICKENRQIVSHKVNGANHIGAREFRPQPALHSVATQVGLNL